MDLIQHLEVIDHSALADLVGDARVIELVEQILKERTDAASRGQVILDAVGGLPGLLEDKRKRGILFRTFPREIDDSLKFHLGVADLYSFRLTPVVRSRLYAFFGGTPPERTSDLREPAVTAAPVTYGLFEHQSRALLECWSHLANEHGRVMLHMPTGAGKTRTAMHLICRHLNQRNHGVVVWLVSGTELCQQAADEFTRAWTALGERPLPVLKLWGGHKGVDGAAFEALRDSSARPLDESAFASGPWPQDLDDAVVIASLETVNSVIDGWGPGELQSRIRHISLIVFDEAHRAIATTYKRAIDSLLYHGALLGLSATPGRRHHGASTEDDRPLVQLFGDNRVVLSIPPYESPVEALVAQGYLAKLTKEQLRVANSTLTAEDRHKIEQQLTSALDLDEDALRVIGLDAVRNLQVVAKAEELVRRGNRRLIVFAPTVESSDLGANLLRARGIQSHSVTSRTPDSERKRAVDLYSGSGASPIVLYNYGVLTAGFDAPATSAVIIARPTASIVLLSQMAGRALRGPKVKGNERATLVTVVDTAIPELVDTVNQFHAFDDAWDAP